MPRFIIGKRGQSFLRQLGNKPLKSLPALIFRRLTRELYTLYQETGWRLSYLFGTDKAQISKVGRKNDDEPITLLDSLFCWTDRKALLAALDRISPTVIPLILEEANRTCQHSFDLLGSGAVSLGKEINWHIDFKSGYAWRPNRFFKRIYPAPFPGGYDIKVPWELSRCQHFVRLGQAYRLTTDEVYAQEFVAQIRSWLAQNPYPFGVNWACPMDVAIRAVSWLWGWSFLGDSPTFDLATRRLLLQSLYQHGRHIFANLERIGGLTNNHYLTNIVGLAYLGLLLPGTEAKRWQEFALAELESEMLKQVYPDGVDFEASISYHRLGVELFLAPTLLAQRQGHTFSGEFMRRLEAMLDYVMYYTKPDGTVPLLGDSDNGRLHRFAVWADPTQEWVDHRYLLAIGAILFDRADFGQAAGDQWQEALWLCGAPAAEFQARIAALPPLALTSHAFPIGGVYIMRTDDCYMVVDAGQNGQNGMGGHAHNDVLSFELYANGQAWLVDPGTYLYTADYAARNQFRATSRHNTIAVDGQEINPFAPADLFRLQADAKVMVRHWHTTETYDALDVEHHGYVRLPGQVIHRRQFYFDKTAGVWVIQDQVEGQGVHTITWHFTLAPGVSVYQQTDDTVLLSHAARAGYGLGLIGFAGIPLRSHDSWVSWSYGERTPAQALEFSQTVNLPVQHTFALCPFGQENEIVKVQTLCTQVKLYWQKQLGDQR